MNAYFERMLRESRWVFVLGLLVLAVALVMYIRAGLFEFNSFDDPSYVSMNASVLAKFSWASVKAAFSPHQAIYWSPLTTLSFMLDSQFYHLWAGGYHATNALWHAANAAAFFGLILALTNNRFAAVLAALLFAVHPAHVEAVAWISARKDVLSTFFGLSSILIYIRWTRRPGAALAVGLYCSFALSLMAKPMFVTLPGLLLLLDFWPLARLDAQPHEGHVPFWPDRRLVIARIREKVLLLSMGVLITFLTLSMHPQTQDRLDPDLGLKIANAFASILNYLGLLIWPSHQALLYPFPDSVPLAQSLGGAALVLAVTGFCLWQARRRSYLLVGWLWFLCTLVPVIMPPKVGLHVAFADRWTYVPFMGLYLALACLAAEVLGKIERPFARGVAVVAMVLLPVIPLGLAQQRQLSTWETPLLTYEQAMRYTKGNYLVLNNYGVHKAEAGDAAAAEKAFVEALQIYPDFGLCKLNLGALLLKQSRRDEALDLLWSAKVLLEKDGQAYDAYRGVAMCLIRKNKLDLAQGFFALAIREQPKRPEAYEEWGALARRLGDPRRAQQFLQQALETKDFPASRLTLDDLKAAPSNP